MNDDAQERIARNREKLRQSVGSDAVILLGGIWSLAGTSKVEFDNGRSFRISLKKISSNLKITKREARELLDAIAESLPGNNGGGFVA